MYLSKIDECDTATEVVKSINILVALRWVAKAWSLVKPETILKCFRKAGILTSDLDVVTVEVENDPFLEADMRMEMQSMINKTVLPGGTCDVNEYLQGDDELPVCVDLDSDNWDTNFMDQLVEDEEEAEQEDEWEDDAIDTDPAPPKIQSFKEALLALGDVQQFLESRGCIEEALNIGSNIDTITFLKLKSSKQTTLRDYY